MIQPSVDSGTPKSSRIEGNATLTADTSMTTRKNTSVVTMTANQGLRTLSVGVSMVGMVRRLYAGPVPPTRPRANPASAVVSDDRSALTGASDDGVRRPCRGPRHQHRTVALTNLIRNGELRSVIDRRYLLVVTVFGVTD